MAENTKVDNETTVEKEKKQNEKTAKSSNNTTEKKTKAKKTGTTKKQTNNKEKIDKKEENKQEISTQKNKKQESTKKQGAVKKQKNIPQEKTENKETKKENKKEIEEKESKPEENKTIENKNKKNKDKEKTKQNNKEIEEVDETEDVAATTVPEKAEKLIKLEDIKNAIQNKKKIPEEEIKKINKILFSNIIIAVLVIIYFIFLNLGYINIENGIYVTDLKVFSMCILLLGIVLLEKAYQKDSGQFAMYGIEMIVISIATIALIYINLMLSTRYMLIAAAISYIIAAYYLIKTIVIYIKKRKEYFIEDMKEIINKDE